MIIMTLLSFNNNNSNNNILLLPRISVSLVSKLAPNCDSYVFLLTVTKMMN